MSQPLISVIVACYNYERYVGSALESVISQDYPNKELIVINDGSTDGSLSVIQRYGQHGQVIDQVNQGHIAAVNRGFAECRGEIVLFLDADDLLEPDALSRVAAAWTPDCAKVQFDLRIIDAEGADCGRVFCNFDKDYDAERAFQRTGTYRWPVTSGNAYSTWFLKQLFPLTIQLAPDGLLNTVAPVYGKVVTIARPLGAYRIHGNNLWSLDGTNGGTLPRRIHQRQHEVATMREHAKQRGVEVSARNVLDSEIAFINYRMLAHNLGLEYEGKAADSRVALLLQACRVLLEERYPAKLATGHLLWFALLSVVPRSVARQLMALRFKRAELRKSLNEKLGLLRRTTRAA